MRLQRLLHKVSDLDKRRDRIEARIYRIANPLVVKVIAQFNKSAACYYLIKRYHIFLQPFNEPDYIKIEIRDVLPRRNRRYKPESEPGLETIDLELHRLMGVVLGADHSTFRVSLSSELFGK